VSRQCPRRRDCPVRRSTDTSRAISFRHAAASVLAGSPGWRQRCCPGCRLVLARLPEIHPARLLTRFGSRALEVPDSEPVRSSFPCEVATSLKRPALVGGHSREGLRYVFLESPR